MHIIALNESFLEEREDYFIALHRLEEKNPRISLQQLEDDNNTI